MVGERTQPERHPCENSRPFCIDYFSTRHLHSEYVDPLNVIKSWILGPHVFRLLRDGGKILGVPIGDSAFRIDWVGEHFTRNAPPIRTLGLLPARTAGIIFGRPSLNGSWQHLTIFSRLQQ